MDPDTRPDQLKTCFKELKQILKSFTGVNTTLDTKVKDAGTILKKIQYHVDDLLQITRKSTSIACLEPNILTEWIYLGEGHFGNVFECRLKGSKVAVKTLKEKAKTKFRESDLLRFLSHDNIVAYRGMGYMSENELKNILEKAEKLKEFKTVRDSTNSENSVESDTSENDQHMFLVMEFMPRNLFQYVRGLETHERHGLTESQTWSVGKQMVSALAYLHSQEVVHRDLKPDNILIEVGPNRIMVKVADFGLAWYSDGRTVTSLTTSSGSSLSREGGSSFYLNIRWGAPELCGNDEKEYSLSDYQRGDMYSFGLVMAYTLTGVKALACISSSSLYSSASDNVPIGGPFEIPKSLEGSLRTAIEASVLMEPNARKTSEEILKECFSDDKNPYQIDPKQVEFFSSGFLEKTDIFVADSCLDENDAFLGFYESGSKERPSGYDHRDLKCKIETKQAPYRDLAGDWSQEDVCEYQERLQKYRTMAKNKEIDNNPTTALKEFVLARPGEDEKQTIEFYFKESDYCHHRSMREIWMSLSPSEKNLEVPCKGEVHPFFSNAFGLHVAILTNEGPDNPQKFVFPQRSKRKGMSSPGNFTCGAVESVSRPDYVQIDGQTHVDLVNTAARGLMEEIGIELTGRDLDAICLTTVYLKFDFHEWGLCGFVDLKDERIVKEHRLSAANIKARFTSGPKDKFEHQTLTFVDFQLEPMLKFVSENHENFASSAKLVVVKVLEAFYGVEKVQKAFHQDIANE